MNQDTLTDKDGKNTKREKALPLRIISIGINTISMVFRVPDAIRMPFGIVSLWSLICIISCFIILFSSKSIYGHDLEVVLPLLITAGILWLIFGVTWSFAKIEAFSTETKEIIEKPDAFHEWLIHYSHKVYLSRIRVLTLIGIVTFISLFSCVVRYGGFWLTYPQPWYESSLPIMCFWILWITASFMAGIGIQVVLGTMVIVHRLSKQRFRISFHLNKEYGIGKVLNFFFSFAMVIAIALTIFLAGVYFSPIQNKLGLLLLSFIFSLLTIFYFFFPKWYLHNAVERDKIEILMVIAAHLESEVSQIRTTPKIDRDTVSRLDTLLSLRNEINAIGLKPIGLLTAIKGIISGLIYPTAVLVLNNLDKIESMGTKFLEYLKTLLHIA